MDIPVQELAIWIGSITGIIIIILLITSNVKIVKSLTSSHAIERCKHIDVREKWLNEHHDNVVSHISRDEQKADNLTKPLLPTKFALNRNWFLKTLITIMALMCLALMTCTGHPCQTSGPEAPLGALGQFRQPFHGEMCVTEFKPSTDDVSIKRHNDFFNIYCYGHNITISGLSRPCPHFVFELPYTEDYEVNGHNHKAAAKTGDN